MLLNQFRCFLCMLFLVCFLVCSATAARRINIIYYPSIDRPQAYFEDEYLVVIITKSEWAGKVVKILHKDQTVAQGYMTGNVGFLGFSILPEWADEQKHDFKLFVNNKMTDSKFYAFIKKGDRPAGASGDVSTHLEQARFLTNTIMATVPVQAFCRLIGSREDILMSEGTGIILTSNGLLLTCDHVVRNATKVQIFYNGVRYDAVKQDWPKGAAADLALLRVKYQNQNVSFATVDLGERVNSNTDEVVLVGYPAAQRSRIESIKGQITYNGTPIDNSFEVEDCDGSALTTETVNYRVPDGVTVSLGRDLPSEDIKGMSGGPVISSDGRVIGILHSTKLECISIHTIRGLLGQDSLDNIRNQQNPFIKTGMMVPMDGSEGGSAWNCILFGFEAISTGNHRQAVVYLQDALDKSRRLRDRNTSFQLQQLVLLGYEQAGPSAVSAMLTNIDAFLNGRMDGIHPKTISEMIRLCARYVELPRGAIKLILNGDYQYFPEQSVILDQALSTMLKVKSLSQLSPDEFKRMTELVENSKVGQRSLYVLGMLADGEQDNRVNDRIRISEVSALVQANLHSDQARMRKAAADVVRETHDNQTMRSLIKEALSETDLVKKIQLIDTIHWFNVPESQHALEQILSQQLESPTRSNSLIFFTERALGKAIFNRDMEARPIELVYSFVFELSQIGSKGACELLKDLYLDKDNTGSMKSVIRQALEKAPGENGKQALTDIERTIAREQLINNPIQ